MRIKEQGVLCMIILMPGCLLLCDRSVEVSVINCSHASVSYLLEQGETR